MCVGGGCAGAVGPVCALGCAAAWGAVAPGVAGPGRPTPGWSLGGTLGLPPIGVAGAADVAALLLEPPCCTGLMRLMVAAALGRC